MKTTKLSNGVEMPLIGFGTYQITEQAECEQAVVDAIQSGYRMIDTAEAYNNEVFVGNAIKKCGVPREELFITTKVKFKAFDNAENSIENSLKNLQVEYIDLVLLHWPFGNYYAAYKVLEKYYKAGKIRAIGVSNFAPDRLIDLINFHETVPHVNQIETHLLCQRKTEREWMAKYNVAHQAYTPLGQGRRNEMFENPIVQKLSKKYQKSPAQIALRFLVQNNIAPVPKSTHLERIAENVDIFDFSFTDAEMQELVSMDEGVAIIGNPQDPVRVESTKNWK